MEPINPNNSESRDEINASQTSDSQNESVKEGFIFLKWLKRILATIGITIGTLVLLLVAVAYLYEDEIKQYAISQLNKKLDVKVSVEEIDFTVFEQFPQASLKFHNTFINDKNSENELDTLFYSENIYFNFNFWSIIEGEYVVKNIKTENTFLNLRVNKKGNENYSILKKDTATVSTEDKFSFALKNVDLENFRINYLNDYINQYYSFHTSEMNFSGDFSSVVYEMEANSILSVDQLSINQTNFLQNKEANLSVRIEVNTDSSSFKISNSSVKIEEAEFIINGTILSDSIQNGSLLDLAISTDNLSISDAFTLLPEKYTTHLDEYQAKGFVWFDASIKGLVSKTTEPDIHALFSVEDGSMLEKTTQESLNKIAFKGELNSNKKSKISSLSINDISASLSDGTLTGSFFMNDVTQGPIAINVKGDLALNKIIRFINVEEIGAASGRLFVNTALNLSKVEDHFIFTKTDGAVIIKDGAVKLKSLPFSFNEINGKSSLYSDNLKLTDFQFAIYEDEFTVNLNFKNFINHFTSDLPLLVNGTIQNKEFNLGRLLVSNSAVSSTNQNELQPLILPDNIKMNVKFQSDKLIFGKFNAKDLTGNLNYSDQKFAVNNAVFNANKGDYTLTSSLEQLTDINNEIKYIWDANVNANQIDISDFFVAFDNFSQEFLTDENIKGTGSVHLVYSSLLLPGFKILDSSIVAIADIDIQNGHLKNQSTLIELAEYLDQNKAVNKIIDTKKLSNKMDNVKFDHLTNSIKIENQIISIPRMAINTNVMDLELLGTHSFTDNVDYHFNFRLRDVMVKNKNQEEFGPIKDDGLGVKFFVHVFGDLNNLNYELDKEERKLSRKENIEEEKTNMKQILKEEFGLFKRDSTITKKEEEKTKTEFQVSFDEFDEDSTASNEIDISNKKKEKEEKKKNNKWLDKLGIKEEEKPKPKFDVENE